MKMFVPKRTLPMLLAIIVGACLSDSGRADSTDGGESVYDRALPSTVWIVAPQNEKGDLSGRVATGTGSVIESAKGKLIITNYHVVGKADKVLVLFPLKLKKNRDPVAERSFYLDLLKHQKGIPGQVLYRDKRVDLALIKLALPIAAKAIPLAVNPPKKASAVHSIGNPGTSGALWVYTPGTVRQVYFKTYESGMLGSKEETIKIEAEIVETTSPINSGDSGGPLLNGKGELVGITQGHLVGLGVSSVSLFISVTEVKRLMTSKKLLPSGNSFASKNSPAEKGDGEAPAESKPELRSPPSNKPAGSVDLTNDPEKRAQAKLGMAQQLEDAGKKEIAKSRYAQIVKDYPNTKAAEDAKKRLEKLKNS